MASSGFSPLLIGGRARGRCKWTSIGWRLDGFSPLLIGGRARGRARRPPAAGGSACFSPLLIGGRARGVAVFTGPVYGFLTFQSPSHRGPRARPRVGKQARRLILRFSPLLIGGRARGDQSRGAEYRAVAVSVPFS